MISRVLPPFVLAALVLTGCTTSTDEAWEPSGDRLETRGLIWSDGSTVHLGDGSRVELDAPVRSYVVGQDGVYAVPESDREGYAELRRITRDDTTDLGVHPRPGSLVTSSDGRYLGFINGSDSTYRDQTPLAEAVVVDVSTGREVLRSSEGMGSARTDDLTDLYEELEPAMLGFDEDAAYFITTEDARKVDLDSGEVSIVGDSPNAAGRADRLPGLQPEATTSPDGTWRIEQDDDEAFSRLVADDGTTVATQALPARPSLVPPVTPLDGPVEPWVSLDSWLDATTAVGWALPPDADSVDAWVLVTCRVPSGSCEPVPGAAEGVLVPDDRLGEAPLVRVPIKP